MLPDVAYGAGRNTYVSGELVIAIFALVVSVVSFEWNRRAARSALHSAETADRHARMPVLSPYFDGRHRGVLFIRNVGNGPAINIMLADGKPILTEAVVDQADRGWSGVAGAVVAGPFDAVGVVAGSLDRPRLGPVPPLRVEVLLGDARPPARTPRSDTFRNKDQLTLRGCRLLTRWFGLRCEGDAVG